MSKPTLSELLDITEGTAKNFFKDKGTCPPLFVAVSSEFDEILVIPAPWQDDTHKLAILSAIRNMFRQKGVIAYAVASEVWVAAVDKNTSPEVAKLKPMQRNDREEGLMVIATNQTGEQNGRYYDIRREPDEPLTLEINQDKTEMATSMGGLLFELLDTK